MNAVADAGIFEERYEPGRAQSVALAAAVHILLALVLVFGVRWQNRPPESISVELWVPPPPVVAERPEPPKPEPRVEPPPKPEPVIEKPDIVLKAPPKPKPEPAKPTAQLRDDPMKRRMQEELAREQLAINVDRERAQVRDQLQRDASDKAMADWVNKVRGKVRGNVDEQVRLATIAAAGFKGNPEAVFDVVQLPTGEVLSVKLRKSCGVGALDDAIERAILKSSPLPKPDRPELFTRNFELRYRPLD